MRTIRSLTPRGYKFRTLAVKNRIQSEVLRLAHMLSREGKSVRIAPALTRVAIANRISMHREAATRELNRCRSKYDSACIDWDILYMLEGDKQSAIIDL